MVELDTLMADPFVQEVLQEEIKSAIKTVSKAFKRKGYRVQFAFGGLDIEGLAQATEARRQHALQLDSIDARLVA